MYLRPPQDEADKRPAPCHLDSFPAGNRFSGQPPVAHCKCPVSEVRDTSQHALTRTSETKGHWQLSDSSAAFRFEVPNRVCCKWCRNFKSAALAILETLMPRHASFVPHGVIPAVLLPFHDDLSIDDKSFRSHLRDVGATQGLSAITLNAHSTEVASCTFDEQRRVLEIAQDEIGSKLPIVNGIWADGSLEAARIARMAADGGASALLVFPPAPFTLQQSPEMALAHFKRIADASDLPIT